MKNEWKKEKEEEKSISTSSVDDETAVAACWLWSFFDGVVRELICQVDEIIVACVLSLHNARLISLHKSNSCL